MAFSRPSSRVLYVAMEEGERPRKTWNDNVKELLGLDFQHKSPRQRHLETDCCEIISGVPTTFGDVCERRRRHVPCFGQILT